MAAGNTYTPIATVSPSGTSLITFSSIPSTYTDLFISYSGKFAAAGGAVMKFNTTTPTNIYSLTAVAGTGSAASSGRSTGLYSIYLNNYSGNVGQQSIQVNVMNYANTTTYKTSLVRAGDPTSATEAIVGLWRNTAAISTIYIDAGSTTFSAGSVCTLYGITAA